MMDLRFPPFSRYFGIETATIEDADGIVTVYLKRRFLPQPETLALQTLHEVTQGERLDNVTARYLDDPTLFWRVADANRAMRPAALTETIGRRLRITLAEGMPGGGMGGEHV